MMNVEGENSFGNINLPKDYIFIILGYFHSTVSFIHVIVGFHLVKFMFEKFHLKDYKRSH